MSNEAAQTSQQQWGSSEPEEHVHGVMQAAYCYACPSYLLTYDCLLCHRGLGHALIGEAAPFAQPNMLISPSPQTWAVLVSFEPTLLAGAACQAAGLETNGARAVSTSLPAHVSQLRSSGHWTQCVARHQVAAGEGADVAGRRRSGRAHVPAQWASRREASPARHGGYGSRHPAPAEGGCCKPDCGGICCMLSGSTGLRQQAPGPCLLQARHSGAAAAAHQTNAVQLSCFV